MLILPAIDLRAGNAVRLHQGDYAAETIYGSAPDRIAQQFASAGAKFLHVVDLDGAKAGHLVNIDALRAIRKAVSIPIEVGGGLRNTETLQKLFDLGVNRAILGTAALRDPAFRQASIDQFGDAIAIGLDCRNGKPSASGWLEDAEMDGVALAKLIEHEGAKTFIVTDIATDGTLAGPNLAFLKSFTTELKADVIASGGIGSLEDVQAVRALEPKVTGLIIGKAIYEKKIDLAQLFA